MKYMICFIDRLSRKPWRMISFILLMILFSVLVMIYSATQARAVSAIPEASSFRQKGPQGLLEFKKLYGQQLAEERSNPHPSETVAALRKVLDEICQQKDCDYSYLYWYTDLAQARRSATKANKPILSLRLLGNLSEDLSCANSRFFRLVLYSHPQIADYLRKNFILHWSTVRPAPKITVDYGDGRKLVNTITGNSIHYVLSPQGKILDVLPGLYDPQSFLNKIKAAKNYLPAQDYKAHYQKLYQKIAQAWEHEVQKAKLSNQEFDTWLSTLSPSSTQAKNPSAQEAARLAITKKVMETPSLVALRNRQARPSPVLEDPVLRSLAGRSLDQKTVHPQSWELIKRKSPQMFEEQCAEVYPCPLVSELEQSLKQDTVQNEYLLRPQILNYLSQNSMTALAPLNDWVYAQVFLSPASDPWLGLKPNTLTGVFKEGLQ